MVLLIKLNFNWIQNLALKCIIINHTAHEVNWLFSHSTTEKKLNLTMKWIESEFHRAALFVLHSLVWEEMYMDCIVHLMQEEEHQKNAIQFILYILLLLSFHSFCIQLKECLKMKKKIIFSVDPNLKFSTLCRGQDFEKS